MLPTGKGRALGRQAPVRAAFSKDPQVVAMATSNADGASDQLPYPSSNRRCVPGHEQGRGVAENGGWWHGAVDGVF